MDKKMKECKKEGKVRCSNCSSNFGYVRIKEKVFQCRNCGCITKLKKEEILNG